MLSDIEISRQTPLRPIAEIAAKLGINEDKIEPYGRHIAKLPLELIDETRVKQAKLILVTSISPTLAGIGKTTVSVGLALGLNHIGKRATVALREPSLGPCFGRKGGAAGGGYAQVLPMEKINLHFTGDFHAITAAHNMITALMDNYDHFNAGTPEAIRERLWKRVLDVNDRQLRQIVTGLGGTANGKPLESGFDITAASEIMAILCLAQDLDDLRARIDNILLGFRVSGAPLYVRDLKIGGAIVTLLKDALSPNLVQTTEQTPALVHGGPFANIAHGCNSVIATRMALSLSDYVVTEAGFGADLGAEKFFNIKCRKTGLQPSLTVMVATIRGLKMHGGVASDQLSTPNPEAVKSGLANLQRHLDNLGKFGQSVVVAFNRFGDDTDEEIELVRNYVTTQGVGFAINNAFAEGGQGAAELAELVVKTIEQTPSKTLNFSYDDNDSITQKVEKVAKQVYGAKQVHFQPAATKLLKRISDLGLDHLPVCIAKTQFSFSADPQAYGAVSDFDFEISDLVINSGAGFIVAIAGNMMRMPGLPKVPQALHIDIVDGEIVGLS